MTDGTPEALYEATTLSGPIRLGILCDGPTLAAWQIECIRHVQALPYVEFPVLIVNGEPAPIKAGIVERVRRSLSNGILLWRAYEKLVVRRKSKALRPGPLPSGLAHLPKLEVRPTKIGKFRQTFDDDSVDSIAEFDLDVLLRFGFGILCGRILDVPRYGVWSFHHGDPERFRGAPPGFWEIERGASVTGVVLQRLTEKLDGGIILHSGWFKTHASNYTKSLDRILFGGAHFVARTLLDLRRSPRELLSRAPLQSCGPVYRYPKTLSFLRFIANSVRAWCSDQYRSLFRHQQWTVGVVRASVQQLIGELDGSSRAVSNADWLPEAKGRFLADPFPVPNDRDSQEILILAEDFNWHEALGQIVAIEWPWKSPTPIRQIINSRCHLSYPYTFKHDGAIYCVPETANSAEIGLYKLNTETQEWTKESVLIHGVRALDSTIFFHEDRWWLFFTQADFGPNEVLHAWHAENLRGEWSAHAANPIKVDARSARPAGAPFLLEGKLIRPAQDCSSGYGQAISFNEIVKLTTHEFSESVISKLLPERGRYSGGLHTISASGDLTIIDGARTAFVPAEFHRAIRRKLERKAS